MGGNTIILTILTDVENLVKWSDFNRLLNQLNGQLFYRMVLIPMGIHRHVGSSCASG
jgi:hypothetical protein